MTQQELRVLEKIAVALEDINRSVKAINDTMKKSNSNTNKSTMTYKLVETIEKLDATVKTTMSDVTEAIKTKSK